MGADGKATKCTTYYDDLNCPTGFQFYKDGVMVMKSPELLYLRDPDGTGKGRCRSACSTGSMRRILIMRRTRWRSSLAARFT